MNDTPFDPSEENLLRRIRAEFLEMPGLRLTGAQAQRLWGLDLHTWATVRATLVDAKSLVRGSDGRYMRLGDGAVPATHSRMLKAHLDRDSIQRRRDG